MELARPKKKKPVVEASVAPAAPSAPPPEELACVEPPATAPLHEEHAVSAAVAPEYAAPPPAALEYLRQLVATADGGAAVSYPVLAPAAGDECLLAVKLPFFRLEQEAEAEAARAHGQNDRFAYLLQRYRESVGRHFAALDTTAALGRLCGALEDGCWVHEVRYVTEKRLCGDNTAVEERHEFVFAQLQPDKVDELRRTLDALQDANFRASTLAVFEMDVAYEDIVQFLQTFFEESGMSRELAVAGGPPLPVVAWHPAEQPRQWGAAAAVARHFVGLLLRESHALPAESAAGRVHRAAVEALLRLVAGPLQRVWSAEDVLRVARAVVATPGAGWAAFLVQLPPVFGALHHAVLALQLLEELLTAPQLTGSRSNDEEWVLLRESGDGGGGEAGAEAGIQTQDDLELLFAQVPLAEMARFALGSLPPRDSLAVGTHALRLLLAGARRLGLFPHFARVLGQAAVRLLRVWSARAAPPVADALCEEMLGTLLGQRHLWCFLRDLPFELCSAACAERLLRALLQGVAGGEEGLEGGSAARLGEALGRLSLQTATHVLGGLERAAAAHPPLRVRVLELLLEVGFVVPASSALLYKLCRSLLGALCAADPALVSHLLARAAGGSLWTALAFLLRELPLRRWTPGEAELALLRSALLQPPEAEASRAARQLLDGLDYGWRGDAPALGAPLHRALALLAAEVMAWHDDNFARRNAWFGWRSVGGSAAAVELYDWLWGLAARTLHADRAGAPLLEPLDLSLPVAAVLRPREPTAAAGAETAEAEASNSASLAAWLAIAMARFSAPQTTVPALLARLAACTNPRAEAAFFHALTSAAPLLARSGAELGPVSETLRGVAQRAAAGGGFLLEPLWVLVGSARRGAAAGEGRPNWLAQLCPRQIAAAAAVSREAAAPLAAFWTRLLTGVAGWQRLSALRAALEAVARACALHNLFGPLLASFAAEAPLTELSDIGGAAAAAWSPAALVPAALMFAGGAAAQWAALRDRLAVWAAAHPCLTLALLLQETRRQAADWRLLGRTGELAVKDPNALCLFQWAGVCERLTAATAEPPSPWLVLYWQMFFLLYFERSASGKTFAPELLAATSAALPSRLAAALERLSARTGSAVFNAFSLWLRHEGPPVGLVDAWLSLPPSFCGAQLLQRFARGASPLDRDVPLWTDLLPEAGRMRAELLRDESGGHSGVSATPLPPPPPSRGQAAPLLAVFSPTEAVPAPGLPGLGRGAGGEEAGGEWARSAEGLRGALVTELDELERVARAWHDGLALTTALHCELLEAVAGRWTNVEETRLVNRPCGRGPLNCARAAQFIFRGSAVQEMPREQQRLQQTHAALAAAVPRAVDTRQAVAASLGVGRLLRRLLALPPEQHDTAARVGREIFFRLADAAAGAPFPPLLAASRGACETLAARFLAGPGAAEEILVRILARPERAPLLAPFFVPHAAAEGFVAMLRQVAESAAAGEALREALLARFDAGEWLAQHSPPVSQCAVFAAFLLRTAGVPGTGVGVRGHLLRTAAALARFRFPQLLQPVLEGLLDGEAPLGADAWRVLLLEDGLCRRVRDPELAERLAALLAAFLWRRRGLRNPPRSTPLLEAGPHWAASAAALACQLADAAAFRGPEPDEPYGLMRAPDPAAAWRLLCELLRPFVQTLGLQPGAPVAAGALHFPPWRAGTAAAGELVRGVWAPAVGALVSRWPAQLLRPCWALLAELLPASPPHVQAHLCELFAPRVPWELLEAADEPFARAVGACLAGAAFPAASLANLLAFLVSRLPLFQGTVEPGDAAAAAAAFVSLATLLLAVPAGDPLLAGGAHVLAPLLAQGLPGLWRRLERAALEQVLARGAAWAQETARRCVDERSDARVQLGAVLGLLEQLGAQCDALWVGSVLMGQLLPCTHLVTLCLELGFFSF